MQHGSGKMKLIAICQIRHYRILVLNHNMNLQDYQSLIKEINFNEYQHTYY
jgi:hypothetical protein